MTTENAINVLRHLSPPRTSKAAFDAFRQAIDMAIEALEQHEPHWIPVTERLPEDDTVVLVCGKGGGVYTAIHNNSKTWIQGWWKMNSKNHHCNPIAWMPLPEPYKGVTE